MDPGQGHDEKMAWSSLQKKNYLVSPFYLQTRKFKL